MRVTVTVTVTREADTDSPAEQSSATLKFADDASARTIERSVALTAEGLVRKLEGENASPTPISQGGRG